MSDVLKDLSDALANSVSGLAPSVVRIDGRRRLPGTGVVWSADGVIVTAHHILERDDSIEVTLNDGTTHSATLIGRDPANDLAVLRVNAELTPANWADDSTLQVGNLVLALGRPGKQVQATLGVTSALIEAAGRPQKRRPSRKRRHRRMHRPGRVLLDGYIQTDVVMYPGFSGGPLVSAEGRVHGLNTSGFRRGVSVTVPVATIRKTVETLLSHGKIRQGYLGVGIQPVRLPDTVSDNLEQETGLLVMSVEGDSPAATASLLVGDIIVSLDGEAITHVDDLLGMLSGDRVGQEVAIEIVRGGALQEHRVTIAERA